ncbi:MAG: GGDEF domain-containing protein [Terriglobia bacterium]|jgi:diguanylate cyclase (GGDEF)-like protein
MSKGEEGMPEYWLDLITDTLKQLDVGARGAFLQKFLQSLVGRGASEEESISHWEGILARQSQWAEKLGRPVTLRTAVVDYFEELSILRNPVLLEYEELKKLRYNAATDSLTGLNNRRMFEEYLGQEIDRSTRYGSPFALLSFDLRNFKSVNDIYGHAAGDEILRSLARASLETLRGSDIPCRIGGDEFAILLPQADRPGSEVLAGRIARKFEEYARSLAPGAPVGVDYGIAIFPEEGHDVTSLLAAADRSLYTNKQKAHDRSAGLTVPPQVTAPQTEEPARQIKVEQDHREVHRPPSPSAPTVPAEAGKKVQIPENVPDGRRFKRIRLEGTPALGIVRVAGKSYTVKVLDASRVGVGILIDQTDLPEVFQALLQVPILPRGQLAFQRIYSLPLPEGKRRVGCVLTSTSGPK